MATSEAIFFSIEAPEPFPTVPIIAVVGVSGVSVVVSIGLLTFKRKQSIYKKDNSKNQKNSCESFRSRNLDKRRNCLVKKS